MYYWFSLPLVVCWMFLTIQQMWPILHDKICILTAMKYWSKTRKIYTSHTRNSTLRHKICISLWKTNKMNVGVLIVNWTQILSSNSQNDYWSEFTLMYLGWYKRVPCVHGHIFIRTSYVVFKGHCLDISVCLVTSQGMHQIIIWGKERKTIKSVKHSKDFNSVR